MKSVKRNSNDQPWITDDFHRLIGLRQHHYHAGNEIAFRFFRNAVNRCRKNLKRRFYENKMKNLKSKNPKDWWNDVKEITGRRSQKNDLQGLANNLCDGDKPKLAEMISASLVAVCDDIIPLTPMDTFDNNKFTQVPDKYIITVSVRSRKVTLSRINTRKATGWHGS